MTSVSVVAYREAWPRQFERVRAELLAVFPEGAIEVEHIGSTAVPGLAAKPVIDVALGAATLEAIEAGRAGLAGRGYAYVARYEAQIPERRYFTRAGSQDALRVHLHGVVLGSPLWQAHLRFRDALRADDALRDRYQALKRELAARFAHDKAAYTAAKAPFIQAVIDA